MNSNALLSSSIGNLNSVDCILPAPCKELIIEAKKPTMNNMKLKELLNKTNKYRSERQYIKLVAVCSEEKETKLASARTYEGDVENESFINDIRKFLDLEVQNITTCFEDDKNFLRITVYYDIRRLAYKEATDDKEGL